MSTDQKTTDWYNQNAASYAKHVRTPDESIYHSLYEKPAMYALLPDLKHKTVISIGCGTGEDSNHLKELGSKKSVGIDISEGLIEIARSSHPSCEFSVMNMENLDYPDAAFDFAYSSLALHYVASLDKVLAEVSRILKPGGFLLFSHNHPVASSMETSVDKHNERVTKLEKRKDRTTDTLTITGDYLATKKIIGPVDFPVTAWHRSFGDISASIFKAGFLIEQIVEPKPLEKMKELAPNDFQKLNKIPDFIIFRLYKK